MAGEQINVYDEDKRSMRDCEVSIKHLGGDTLTITEDNLLDTLKEYTRLHYALRRFFAVNSHLAVAVHDVTQDANRDM